MTQPWYRQFWPWFIIALPCAAVVGSIATAIIAIKGGVEILRDARAETKKSERRSS